MISVTVMVTAGIFGTLVNSERVDGALSTLLTNIESACREVGEEKRRIAQRERGEQRH